MSIFQFASRSAHAGRLLALLVLAAATTGCVTQPVGSFQPSFERVGQLKAAGSQPVAVDAVTGGPDRLSVRGNGAISPVGKNFGDYLKAALEAELGKAERLSAASNIKLRANIIETDINAAGASTANATLTALVTVDKAAQQIYSKQFSARHEWESSFVGAVAIPRAIQAYPGVVEAFLNQLYADPEFKRALNGG